MVKHLSATERFWFSIDFAGLDVPWPYPDEDPHGNFRLEDGDTLEAIVEEYVRECERSRAAIAGAGLDDKAKGKDMDFNLRYALDAHDRGDGPALRPPRPAARDDRRPDGQ